MSIIIISVLIGLGHSVSWGLSSWLNWQWMKNGTIIPSGSFTSKYGHKASFVLKGLSVFVLLNVLISFKWWVVLTTGIMLFIGGEMDKQTAGL